MTRISREAAQMLEHAREFDGLEVHEDDWPLAEEIVKAGLGYMSGARGPGRAWRRLHPEYEAAYPEYEVE